MAAVAVLGFHKIGAPPAGTWETWNYVPVDRFIGYLELLNSTGWQPLDLEAFLAGLERPCSLPERSVLLTFDDGYRSMLEVAEPRLHEFGYPSVLFVPTDYVGGTNRFDAGNEPEERICDWDELRELDRRGVAVQSHGASHRAFSDLDSRQQRSELETSRALLEAKLGRDVHTFAFPYGDCGREPEATDELACGAGYRAAFLYHGGVAELPAAAPYRIARIPIGPDTELERKLETGGVGR